MKIACLLPVGPFLNQKRHCCIDDAVATAYRLVREDGADVVHLFPGEGCLLSEQQEIECFASIIKSLRAEKVTVPIAVETARVSVVKHVLEAGATWIHDPSGFADPDMRKIVSDAGCMVSVVHAPHEKDAYESYVCEHDIVHEVIDRLRMQANMLLHDGIKQEHIVLDPGLSEKSIEDVACLLSHVEKIQALGFKTSFFVSKRQFLKQLLKKRMQALLAASIAVHTFLLLSGVDYIRVDDVRALHDARNIIKLLIQKGLIQGFDRA